jgi:chromosome partitioning protein
LPRSARVLAVANQKGGVGKTTTAISVAASLAVLEREVLLVDFDPQGHATSGLGVDKATLFRTSYDWLGGGAAFEEVAQNTDLPHLTLAPANRHLVGAEVELVGEDRRERRLAERIDPLRDRYEYILIDCPPSLSLLTVNALVAADGVLVPIQCEYFALEGVSELLATIERIRESLNPGLGLAGVVATMWDERTNLSRQVLAEIRKHFGGAVFENVVPRSVRLGEAPSFGKPILLYDVKSKGAEAYLGIARELLRRDGRRPVASAPGC